MPSKFGGIQVEKEPIRESKFGGVPVSENQESEATENIDEQNIISPMKQTISRYARPILEGIPAAVGAIGGSALGPMGTAAGGGLGYAIGDELADTLDQYLGIQEQKPMLLEIGEAARNVALGSTYEVGGQLAGQVLGRLGGAAIDKVKNIMPFTKLGVENKAGKILAAETSSGPLIAKNAEEAWLLEDSIPGLKFSRGELTNDPNVIKFERAAAREPGGFAASLKERQATNNEAIRNFIKGQKGAGTRDDVLLPLSKEREALDTGIDTAKSYAAGITPEGGNIISSGEAIRGAARTGEKTASKQAGTLFDDVPEFGIDVSGLKAGIEDISKPFSKIENVEKNVPAIFDRMARVIDQEQGILTPNDLQGFRSELLEKIRESGRSATPNRRLESRLSKMVGVVDDELDKAATAGKRFERKAISDKYPSADDLKEYEKVSSDADMAASESILKDSALEESEAYKAFRKKAEEIVDSSDDFSDWTDAINQGGINLETAHMTSDPETIKALLSRRPTLFRRGGSIHAEHLANEKGFDSADELFQTWLNKKPRQEAIKDVADDFLNEYQVGKEFEQDQGEGYLAFLDKSIEKGMKGFSKNKPKTTNKNVMEVVERNKQPGDELAAQKLKTAQGFFKKEVIEKFRSGTVGDILAKGKGGDRVVNSQVASKFFQPGARGVEVADDFLKSIGGDETARTAMSDYIRQDMLDKTISAETGDVVGKKLNAWVQKNKPALERYGLLNEFSTLKKATSKIDDAIKLKAEFDKSEASKLLGADVGKEVLSALSKGSKRQAAIGLMRKLKGNDKAISGLQNTFIDEVMSNAETTAVDAFQNKTISVASLDKALKDYDPAIKVLFEKSPKKIAALTKTRDALRIMQRSDKSPIGNGSDTFENLVSFIAKGAGFTGSRLINIVQAAMTPIKKLSDDQVHSVINRALLDPDIAYNLMSIATGKYKPNVIERKLTQHLSTIGLVSNENNKEQK